MEFRDKDEFEDWLKEQPSEFGVAIAARAALRVWPLVMTRIRWKSPEVQVKAVLQNGSALVISPISALTSSRLVARRAAAASACAYSADVGANADRVVDRAAAAAAFAAGASGDIHNDLADMAAATYAGDAVAYAAAAATYAAAAAADRAYRAATCAAAADVAAAADADYDAKAMLHQDLWHGQGWPEELDPTKLGPSLLDDSDFAFLRRWFFAMAEGTPLPTDLMTRIALEIDQDVWNSGDPKAVAAAIEAIEAHYNVTKALDALDRDRKTVVQNRYGIGGNQPPEPVDDAHPLAGPVTVIWAAAQDIREETERDEPDKTKVEVALAALKSGLNAILVWCGKKADLAIDTAIKWGVPAAGGGYVALNPDKVGTLIKAVEAWLPHLP